MTKAMAARWVLLGLSMPTMFATNPAAPSATATMAMTRVHMYAQPANQP